MRTRDLATRLAVGVAALALPCLMEGVPPASAKAPGPNGQITFYETNGADRGTPSVHIINSDGSHARLLSAAADAPRWSPDGTQVAMECYGSRCGTAAALIVNSDSGSSRLLPSADPTLGLGCFVWSPHATRLLCGTLDEEDPSRNGLYTVRSSDGGDLTRVSSFGQTPGDYSPDGTRISFVGADSNGDVRLYVARADGVGAPQAITPAGVTLVDDFGGSWSPTGDKILFVARPTPDSRRAIWVVNADGSGLREIPVPGCGGPMSDVGSIGCDAPSWSPDGTEFVFTRFSHKTHMKNIYTVNADGSGLLQVTRTGFQDFAPDWGTHPLAR